MTIIEFYDKVAIENIIGALLCRPKKVILIGDEKQKKGDKVAALYQKVLENRGQKARIAFKHLNRNDLKAIVQSLADIVEENEECVFDLTGGEELYLVAVGIIMQRYEGKVHCHRFNLKNETLSSYDDTGKICKTEKFEISVEECINIYGGEMVTDSGRISYTHPWDFNEEFVRDIDAMWSVCRKNPKLWNSFIATISGSCDKSSTANSLICSVKNERISELVQQKGENFEREKAFALELQKRGLISLKVLKDRVSIKFKNEQVKRCLTVSGQVLELAVASKLRAFKNKDGSPVYHDVKVGVVIDWNDEDGNAYNTNEIDVFAMKGVCPVFISCKNGDFDVNELYKLNTVAARFGSKKYAKKVLATTQRCGSNISLRMEDMGVLRVDRIGENELANKLRAILG